MHFTEKMLVLKADSVYGNVTLYLIVSVRDHVNNVFTTKVFERTVDFCHPDYIGLSILYVFEEKEKRFPFEKFNLLVGGRSNLNGENEK